jgi:iron complex transport system permease protein
VVWESGFHRGIAVLFRPGNCNGEYHPGQDLTSIPEQLPALKIMISRVVPIPRTWLPTEEIVVLNIRLPRILAAGLIGAGLSVAGAAYQGIFRNPMVSPDLLGASNGAGFGAALAILLGAGYFIITLSSFVFGLVAVFLSFSISKASRIRSTMAMVLSGIVVRSLFQSGTSFIKLIADTESQLPAITYWLMGSLVSIKPKDILFASGPIIFGLITIFLLRWRINILTVSEAEARSLGVHTGRLRFIIIISATLITAAAVSISGMIGWVGLVIPHFCRIIFGQNYKRLIPTSALMGASYLIFVDNMARTLVTSEIPIGILTAFIGAPVFIYLIIRGGNIRDN